MPMKSGIDKLSSISSLSSNISARVAGSAGDDAGISEVKDRFVEHVDEQSAEEEGEPFLPEICSYIIFLYRKPCRKEQRRCRKSA